jgi:hypothetical protein
MRGGDLIEEVLTAAGDDALIAVAELIESLKKREAPAFSSLPDHADQSEEDRRLQA